METIRLRDRDALERFFRGNPELHVYSIGDLDEFFWPDTTWYALTGEEGPAAIALLYTGYAPATLVAISEQPALMADLLKSIMDLLPERFYAHLSGGVGGVLRGTHELESHGEHYKMALRDLSAVRGLDCSQAVRLGGSDLPDIIRLNAESYPGNWFEPRMLASNQYFGIRKDGRLVSVAGVHVYSRRYRVAALGNITTHPAFRRRGYGTLVTARLCQSLLQDVEHIGLNVKADNAAAISCYRKLGFEVVASYEEVMVRRR